MKNEVKNSDYEAGYLQGRQDAINDIKVDIIFPDPIAKYLEKRFPDPRNWVVVNTYDVTGKLKEVFKK